MLKMIKDQLELGNLSIITDDIRVKLNNEAVRLLNLQNLTEDDINNLRDLIIIGNLVYNNSSMVILPIEDGIYDLLVAKLQKYDYNKFTPGAKPVIYNNEESSLIDRNNVELKKMYITLSDEDSEYADNMLFPDIIHQTKQFTRKDLLTPMFQLNYDNEYITKRIRNVSHNYPELVGTLDKCKFVLNSQAKEVGAFNEDNVKVLERDFFQPLLSSGIINYNNPIGMVGTIKYDGVSVEADVTNTIISARTRGDTDNNEASDITPILQGYRFPNAPDLDKPIGMKFEAIIMYHDLERLNKVKGTNYINGRLAIIGLIGSSDAYKYRDYITLIPLQADFGEDNQPDRLTEIAFLNKYYTTKECLKYVVFNDTYINLLYQIKKYVEEAEFARKLLPFMYDGVVLEFLDPNIRKLLGRKNNINQYAMAVKFNALKKQTIFRGYTYTVGQDGSITPMLHYDPVEFIGSIHTKSTGSSYDRFKKLDLRIGDVINLTYVNDVMPYVTKCDVDLNIMNHTREILDIEKFPTRCPSCGSELVLSKSGKSIVCLNLNCVERSIQRMSNMLAKLGIKDFSESTIDALGKTHLYELMNMTVDDLSILGPLNAIKLYDQLQNLKVNKLQDYRIIGALGFTNIGAKKWKLIFQQYPLCDIIHDWYNCNADTNDYIRNNLANIKGIGPITADIIIAEMEFFMKDIDYIIKYDMYIKTIPASHNVYKIRFTGFRDRKLEEVLNKLPYIDCDGDAGITKDTSILLVPTPGYSSGTKVQKALKYGVQVVPVKEFLDNPSLYIPDFIDSVNL